MRALKMYVLKMDLDAHTDLYVYMLLSKPPSQVP